MPWEKNFDARETLEKAMQAFWARGYSATSIQDLVDCTGVNRASLYATYGDKRALFLAALRLYDKDFRRARLSALEQQLGPREALERLFQDFIERSQTDKSSRGCFLANAALELAAHDAEIRHVVAESQADIEAFFRRIVTNGRAQGVFRAEIDPAVAARSLLTSVLGFLVLLRSRPDPDLLRSVADDVMARLT